MSNWARFAALALAILAASLMLAPAASAGNNTTTTNTSIAGNVSGNVSAGLTATPSATPTPTATATATPTATVTGPGPVEQAYNDSVGELRSRVDELEGQVQDAAAPNGGAAKTVEELRSGQKYNLEELKRNGKRYEKAPASMRFLGDYGSATVRWDPVSPMTQMSSRPWKYLERGEVVQRNEIRLKTVRLGEDIENPLDVHVVYWEKGTRQVKGPNGSTRSVAVPRNVSEETVQVTLGQGYDVAKIPLTPHYDDPVQVTAWVEEYPDARWRFSHESIPLAASMPGWINSLGDMVLWSLKNILLVAGPGILVAGAAASVAIRRTYAGPMRGTLFYLIVLGALTWAVASWWWFTAATVIAQLPMVLGGVLVVVGFVAFLEVAGSPDKRVLFERFETQDAEAGLSSDLDLDVQDALFADVEEARVVDTGDEGRYAVVSKGCAEFVARVWASPAILDVQDVKTRLQLNGRWSEKLLADSSAEEALDFSACGWELEVPLRTEDGAINLDFLLKAAAALGAGWWGGSQLGLAGLGTVIGVAAVAAMSLKAVDGSVEFDAAPIHLRSAMPTLAAAQDLEAVAGSLEEAQEQAWEERAATLQDALQHLDRRDATMIQQLLGEEMNGALDVDDLNGEEKKVLEKLRAGEGGED